MRSLLAVLLLFGDLHYRWIGPAVMGGRLDAVAGVPGNPKIVYLGHSSGGLWKISDGGLTFSSAFEAGQSSAVGAIAIDPRNPQHVVIGTGEPFPRNTADAGDGLWSSNDGGTHWRHLGLEKSGSIAKILFDPRDPRRMLVAVMGDEFGPGDERGIYRSTDGGAHWTRTLFVNPTTGGSDLALDVGNPSVVYAGVYDYLRKPWTFRSGGPGSGLYRSHDFGKTWARLTGPHLQNGLPEAPIDRVGVSVCASNPRIIYALVPSRTGLLYRSTDGGDRWQMRNKSQSIDFRPFYFSQVRCDPRDPSLVYSLGSAVEVSRDAGHSFKPFDDAGGDNHDLWIDPRDSQRLLNASDMGFKYSLNGGRTWNNDDVVPFDQVYRVGFDYAQPYHIMGGLQDHEVWWGPSALFSQSDAAGNGEWLNIADWGDGQYAMADPRDPSIVYEDTHFGDLARLDLRAGTRQYISPRPIVPFGGGAIDLTYRFNWSAPLLLSHFDPSVVYFGGNLLFRSPDEGQSWAQFSPDLTRCDPAWLAPSGGPIALDNTNAETFCTITSIAEDALDPKTLWYGTDNGHLELTREAGRNWTDVSANIRGVPQPSRVSCVSASPSRSLVAYAAFDRHQWNDARPYAFRTTDGGSTWQPISAGLNGYVHVLREDPRNPDLLYAGTERGIFVSFDSGAHWSDLRLGLPHLPVYDLQVQPRDNDLIVGTHGRGFYILDDLTPLQQWSATAGRGAVLFAPMPAFRYAGWPFHEHGRGAFVAENKPYGALVTLYLAKAPPLRNGRSYAHVRVYEGSSQIDAFDVVVHVGMNRFTWDLNTQSPGPVQDSRPYYVFYPMAIAGPPVLPGKYTLSVQAGADRMNVPVTVNLDPKEHVEATQLQQQYDALERLAGVQERAEAGIAQLESFQRKFGQQAQSAALLDRLRNADPSGYRSPARLSEQIAYLRHVILQYDGAPTLAQRTLIDQYAQEMDAIDRDIATVVQKLRSGHARF